MIVNRIWVICITFVTMIILSVLTKNIVVSGVITFVAVVTSYIIIVYFRGKKRLNLLDEQCDPQAFIEATEKQMNITGKNPKINAYININKVAGFIVMGEFQKAKDILCLIDKSYLSAKTGTLLAYTMNLIICSYELGEISYAEELFETKIPLLSPINPRMILSMKLLMAERFFFLNRFEESKRNFQQLLKEKINTRERLDILYRLARIDEINGDVEAAKQKYKEVSDVGDKLWISIEARKKLSNLKDFVVNLEVNSNQS